jgi:hypothetical protein
LQRHLAPAAVQPPRQSADLVAELVVLANIDEATLVELCSKFIEEFPALAPCDVIDEVVLAESAAIPLGLEMAQHLQATATIVRNNLRARARMLPAT